MDQAISISPSNHVLNYMKSKAKLRLFDGAVKKPYNADF